LPNQETIFVRIWDPFVRVAHWTIVIAFVIAYVTEDDLLSLHVWAGYVIGLVVLMRLIWGFIGPKHARFTDFLYRPSEVWAYVRGLTSGRAHRFLGHSPAGGAMVVMLILGLLTTVGSGLWLYAIEKNAGPLAGLAVSHGEHGTTIGHERPDDDHDDDEDDREDHNDAGDTKDDDEFWEETHELLANLTLFLVILHVAGVLLASYVHRENLVKAMITGLKRGPSIEGSNHSNAKD
jgi:cytochrome b